MKRLSPRSRTRRLRRWSVVLIVLTVLLFLSSILLSGITAVPEFITWLLRVSAFASALFAAIVRQRSDPAYDYGREVDGSADDDDH